jgi:hypothetical protein
VCGTLDVATDRKFFIGGAAFFSSPFWCVRSSDAQNPDFTSIFDQSTLIDLGGGLLIGVAFNQGSRRMDALTMCGCDTQKAVNNTDFAVVLFLQQRWRRDMGAKCGREQRVYFVWRLAGPE